MIPIGVDIGGSHISSAQILWHGKSAEITEFHEADIDTFRSASEIINLDQVIRYGV